MTIPQFNDTPSENVGGGDKRDPSEFIPWTRVAEVKTPRGTRPGLVLIVRPLERIPDYRDKNNDWKTLVIADIAVLDPIGPGADEYGMPLPPIPAGSQWRNQTVFPGMLNKAWRDKIGNTLIGVVYMGEAKPTAQGTMGKAPFLWRSLAQDTNQTNRGQRFFAARPEFLIPVPRNLAPVQDPWAHQQPPVANQAQYATPYSDPYATTSPHAPAVHGGPQYQQQDPWGHSQGHPAAQEQQQWQQAPQYQQQPPQGYAAPVSPAPAGNAYQQPDPWDQTPTQAVVPAQAPAPQQRHPNQGMSTLDQLKAGVANHQGQQQAQDPPF